MPADDGRREVARRLRGLDCSDLQDSLIRAYLDAPGVEGYEDRVSIAHRLADLMGPGGPEVRCVAEAEVGGERLEKPVHDAAAGPAGVDRDALLALADDVDKQTDGGMLDIWLEDGHCIARRIRGACGEEVRNG